MSVNEDLFDAAVSHAIDLQRYTTWMVQRVIGLLNRTDNDLVAALSAALDRLPPESFTVERLEGLLTSVRQINLQAYNQIERELNERLREFAAYEAQYQLQLFQSVIPAQVVASVGVAAVNMAQIEAAVLSRPFQGRNLKGWIEGLRDELTQKDLPGLADQKIARIRDAVRMGYVENQTIDQIVRRVRGTRAKGYSDGIIEIDRRNAQAVVRTAVSHTAASARDAFYEANTDLIKAVEWNSTLDSRTTPICQARDKLRYHPVSHAPIGHKVPWLGGPGKAHWSCRSVGVPITKSWKELGVPIEDMTPTTRASMDGQVPAETTYSQWLQRQSAKRQDEVVGPTRGALMRTGKLEFDRLFDNRGQYLTLDQLRERDASAFAKAGLE